MRVALTGATGYLGSLLVPRLLAAGHTVVATRRRSSPMTQPWSSAITWRDAGEAPSELLADCDALLHTACCYGRSGESASALIEANLAWPLRLLESALARGLPRVVTIGTVLPPGLTNYALSKHQFADWCARLTPASRSAVAILAMQSFYGPGEPPGRLVADLVRRCLAGGRVPLSPGTQQRDLIYEDDAAAAVLAVLERPVEAGRCDTIEVGSGQALPVRQIAERVRQLCGGGAQLDFGAIPQRPGEPGNLVADVTALRALGWSPRIALEEGLIRTIASTRSRMSP